MKVHSRNGHYSLPIIIDLLNIHDLNQIILLDYTRDRALFFSKKQTHLISAFFLQMLKSLAVLQLNQLTPRIHLRCFSAPKQGAVKSLAVLQLDQLTPIIHLRCFSAPKQRAEKH